MKYNICIVTGARSEYGLLRNVIFSLQKEKDVNLKVVATGAHLYNDFGYTFKELEKDKIENISKIKVKLGDGSKEGTNIAISDAIVKFSSFFSNYKPDLLIILGDRFEIFAVAIAASILNIPIAHIGGGDTTLGAVDDVFRNSITHMSTLHFPGCEDSKKKIINMGINRKYVFNVGELGVENCLKIPTISKNDLSDRIDIDLSKDFAIVTYHPETMGKNVLNLEIKELVKSMEKFNLNYIITKANADAGGKKINDIWQKEVRKHSNWFLVASLGVENYINCVRYSKLIIGNSSSGIIEVPVLGVPTVNIGDRQKGRMMPGSVITCKCIEKEITKSIKMALNKKKKKYFIYGSGNTSKEIVKQILKYLEK